MELITVVKRLQPCQLIFNQTGYGYNLTTKGVTEIDKHNSLIRYRINYCCKKVTAYMSEAPFRERCSTLGQAPSLTHKHQTRLERLARDKHSGLLRKSVNYGRNKFYDTGSWSLASLSSLGMFASKDGAYPSEPPFMCFILWYIGNDILVNSVNV